MLAIMRPRTCNTVPMSNGTRGPYLSNRLPATGDMNIMKKTKRWSLAMVQPGRTNARYYHLHSIDVIHEMVDLGYPLSWFIS